MDPITKAIEEATQQLVGLSNTLFIVAFLLLIIPYILFAIGISSVASRYGLKNRWMAWVPIARKHLLAEMADIRRLQVGKQKILTTQYEICMLLFLGCLYGITRTNNPLFLIVPAVLATVLAYNQIFSYYYFYKLRDPENATAYFILGLMTSPMNAFFVYRCR